MVTKQWTPEEALKRLHPDAQRAVASATSVSEAPKCDADDDSTLLYTLPDGRVYIEISVFDQRFVGEIDGDGNLIPDTIVAPEGKGFRKILKALAAN